jgi:Zn-dependent peptidase ImmA (M78 family)
VADPDDKLIRDAARQFEVSAQALTIRLTALGLISV